jgi:hypothetical protein
LANNPLASVGNSRNGWRDHWHIAAVTVQYAKELCPVCHSWQILADFSTPGF